MDWDRPSGAGASTTPGSRSRALLELAGVYALLLVVLWTPRPLQWALWGLVLLTFAAIFTFSFDGFERMGLSRINLTRSMWGVAVAVGLASAAVLMAVRMHTFHVPARPAVFIFHYGAYAIFAMLQQLALQCFFLSRSMRLLPDATAAAGVASGLFAIAHLPNPVLTLITLVCGLASCLFFLRYRNLWPLMMAHAILGIAIGVTIPASIDHNMRVGISYITYANRSLLPGAPRSVKP